MCNKLKRNSSKNRIVRRFKNLREKGEKALIPFITAGYPDLKYTEDLIFELEEKGADIIELGIPFSDPLADGPVIQTASYRALRRGVTLEKTIKFVEKIRKKTSIPLIFMGYYNSIFKFGEKKFVHQASEAGVDGVIIADLPPEEAKDIQQYAMKNNLALIFLLTPVSSDDRIKLVCNSSEGFIYCVSYTGVTGQKGKEEKMLKSFIKKVRSFTSTPVAIGFGIYSPVEARKLSSLADGIIVGSAIIRKIMENEGGKDAVKKVGEFVYSLSQAVKG